MATFKDACFHYRKLTKLNKEVLKIGANSSWRPSTSTKIRGWCVDCGQHSDLSYCTCCSLYHVCQWCSQDKQCFLDAAPHLLRMRTLRETTWRRIDGKDLLNMLKLFDKLFPINEKIVTKFENMVKQNKCRNEHMIEWYNHLTLPLTLQSLSIKVGDETYHVFGCYDQMKQQNDTPFYFVNHAHNFDKLILDRMNFDRMENLPELIQHAYALKYFTNSRFLTERAKEILYTHFTKENVKRQEIPTSPINVWRNCIPGYIQMEVSRWNEMCLKVFDQNILNELSKVYREHYDVSERFVRLIKPSYACSTHGAKASKVKKCNWCSIIPSTFWDDFRMKEIYDLIMEFMKMLVKSNTNIGHCSSCEYICEFIPYLFNPLDERMFNRAAGNVFHELNPTKIDNIWYVNMDGPFSLELYKILTICGDPIPRIISDYTFKKIIKHIFNRWFDLKNLRELPLTLLPTEGLHAFNSFDKLIDEYALLISDSEDE
ncbi:NSP1 [Rotavirus A]|uniref:Non-structural protein 1 n=1 Tax=Rotavirus A TaxID=28875 RepID=A0A1V0FU28_9REOV|nr:NSP1 [Rotavirus A]